MTEQEQYKDTTQFIDENSTEELERDENSWHMESTRDMEIWTEDDNEPEMANCSVCLKQFNVEDMELKKCARCNEQFPMNNFRGRSSFLMPWCKECRSLDPIGAKRINDRLRQARLDDEKLKAHNAQRAQFQREKRQSQQRSRNEAIKISCDSLQAADLSAYDDENRAYIQKYIDNIISIVRSIKFTK